MSDLRRFFVSEITGETVTVEGEEQRHAVSVLRIKEGDRVILCDNSGDEYLGTVVSVSKKDMTVSVTEKRSSETEAKSSVTLIAGYLKGDRTELVVQKAVELGVKEIVVFSSEFSSAYVNENKLSRLNRVSLEAAKQCGRATVPRVIYAESLEKALAYGENAETRLFAYELAERNEAELSALKGSVAIVVGSEGGFSKAEAETAVSAGYKTVYLGKRILRAETASVALCSIVMYSLGELC